MKKYIGLFSIALLTFCSPTVAETQGSTPPDHKDYDAILKKYVDIDGMVNYAGLKEDRKSLRSYLAKLESNAPNKDWSEDEKLAYWINAYNAYTLDLIIQHYPVKTIKDIGSTIKIPFVSTAWDVKFIEIGGEKYDLNNIEHGIIRKRFEEPRIHFALVCAAVSCPRLRNEAYFAETLDAQLMAAAKDFLSNPEKNVIKSSKEARLSKIFSWYGGDFKKKTSLIEYLNQFGPVQLEENANIDFMDYNWDLNEQE